MAAEEQRARALSAGESGNRLELTILMPCLNEARTLGLCIAKARSYLARSGFSGEVVIADNGSTDGSQRLAVEAGARVVSVQRRGYGSALVAGIEAAKGRMVVMGDSDASYDFEGLDEFVGALRAGASLVIGNRFAGQRIAGAMPLLNRYLGNPVLSLLGRVLFKVPVRDFHCGLRAFDRDAIRGLGLTCGGMEFASEMVVKAALAGLHITQVPTTLYPDGRNRPPHLRPWRDGWRHLRFLLLFSPRWLFLYPGLALFFAALAQLALAGLVTQGSVSWPTGIHTLLYAAAALVLGYQTILFATGTVLARDLAGLASPFKRDEWALKVASAWWLPGGGTILAALGLALCVAVSVEWGLSGFGVLNPEATMRRLIPGVALLLVGTQSLLASVFFAAMRSAFDNRSTGALQDDSVRQR